MPAHAKETLTGDICCPKGFRFVIESKGGYNKIDLNSMFESGNLDMVVKLSNFEYDLYMRHDTNTTGHN